MKDAKPIPSTAEVVEAKTANPDLYPSHRKTSPADLLAIVVNQGADLAKIEKLMELQERFEANEARKAYVKAMAEFKAEPPTILKSSHVGFKSKKPGVAPTDYDHATLGEIVPPIVSSLSRHGLHHNWTMDQVDSKIKITCTITHVQGHSESTSLTAGADNTGNKNAIQAIGSTATYLQRYTLLSLTGLAAQDQDDDGLSSDPIETISPQQVAELVALADKAGAEPDKFYKVFEIESMEEMPLKKYAKAKSMLNQKLAKSKKDA